MVPTVERGERVVVFCSMAMDGRKAFDHIHFGPLHLIEKLARIGGERLHVTALALGINRVEGQRGLARAGQSGDNREACSAEFPR